MKNEYRKMCSQITPDDALEDLTLRQFQIGPVKAHKKHRVWKPLTITAAVLAFAFIFPLTQPGIGYIIANDDTKDMVTTGTHNTFGLAAYAADGKLTVASNGSQVVFGGTCGSIGTAAGSTLDDVFHVAGTNIAQLEVSIDRGELTRYEMVTKKIFDAHMGGDDRFLKSEIQSKGIDEDFTDITSENKDSTIMHFGEVKRMGKHFTIPYEQQYYFGFLIPAEDAAKIAPITATNDVIKMQQFAHGYQYDWQKLGATDEKTGVRKDKEFFNGATIIMKVTYLNGQKETKTLHLKAGKKAFRWTKNWGQKATPFFTYAVPKGQETSKDDSDYFLYADIT